MIARLWLMAHKSWAVYSPFLDNHLVIQLAVAKIHFSGHGTGSFRSSLNLFIKVTLPLSLLLIELFLFRKFKRKIWLAKNFTQSYINIMKIGISSIRPISFWIIGTWHFCYRYLIKGILGPKFICHICLSYFGWSGVLIDMFWMRISRNEIKVW